MGGPHAPTLFVCGVYQPSVQQCEDSVKMDVWFSKFVASHDTRHAVPGVVIRSGTIPSIWIRSYAGALFRIATPHVLPAAAWDVPIVGVRFVRA